MSEENQQTLANLSDSISESVNSFVKSWEQSGSGRPPLSVGNPAKAQEVLMLLAVGTSGKKILELTGCPTSTVARLKSDWCDHIAGWKEEGGKISGGIYMDTSEGLSDTMARICKAEEEEDWKAVEALSKALQAKNKILEVSHRQSMTARGEASQITREEKVITDADMEDTASAARERLKQMKATAVDVEVVSDI
jgi:hypothetical protein